MAQSFGETHPKLMLTQEFLPTAKEKIEPATPANVATAEASLRQDGRNHTVAKRGGHLPVGVDCGDSLPE